MGVLSLAAVGGCSTSHSSKASGSTTTAAAAATTTTSSTPAGSVSLSALSAGSSQVASELAAGRFASVRTGFNATMMAGLSEQQLASTWAQYAGHLGTFKSAATPIYKALTPGYATYFVPMTFSGGALEIELSFSSNGQIAGFYIRPPGFDSTV